MMINKRSNTILQIVAGYLLLLVSLTALAETSFTYQGRLSQSGQAANGLYDMRFYLFDAQTRGNQVGETLDTTDVDVIDGVFSVMLDFGDGPFVVDPRWLEIDVQEAGDEDAYTKLLPRQRVGASPYAIETLSVAPGAVDNAAIADNAVTTNKINNDAVTSAKIAPNTIGPDDIDGGLYSRKGQVLYYTATASIGFGVQRVTVSCVGARDIPVLHVCNVPSDTTNLTVLSARLTSIDNDVNPARLRCAAENRSPQNAETLTATIGCIPVP